MRHPRYTIESQTLDGLPKLAIVEVWDIKSSVKIIAAWKRADHPPITALSMDLFNCKTDYSKSASFVDLERINDEQAAVAPRYRYLEDSADSRQLIVALLNNAVAITDHLRALSLLLVDTPSRLQQNEAAAAAIHAQFANMRGIDANISIAPARLLPGFERIGGTPVFEAELNVWVARRTKTPIQNATLRYLASEHGWESADFHRTCDNVPRLLVIARSTSGYLFGGFTSVGFEIDSGFKSDSSAFLFTLLNPHGLVPTMLASRVGMLHVFGRPYSHASFGLTDDLTFISNCNVEKNSFSDLNGTGSFKDPTGKGSTLFTGAADGKLGIIAEIIAFSV